MPPTGSDLVKTALTQVGDPYIWAREVDLKDPNPYGFDCSEFMQWIAYQNGVILPDGSWYQLRYCRDYSTQIPVADAINTPGALLFWFNGNPFSGGRPAGAHVALSQGNGKTVEARSVSTGVYEGPANGRSWTHAGLVPGVSYTGEDMTLTDHEKTELKHIIAALDEVNSNGGFAKYAVDLIRRERKTPLGSGGGLTEADVRRIIADAINNG